VGTFVPGADAHPYRGEVGELYREPEVRLEMLAPRGRSAAVVAALLKSHPYEESGIDVHRVVTKYGMVGRVGDLSQALSLRALAETAGTVLGSDPVRIAGDRDQIISRVAVVPGSGSEFIAEARTEGAQVLISADFSHHNAVGATDAGLSVLDVGHARSEGPGMRPLYDWISKLGHSTTDLTAIETSPWKEQ
jgi:putative NIF3 family GTP cyclohydrolase 1 type 2